MCDICRKTPCDPRCPNAPEESELTSIRCEECNRMLERGERYARSWDGYCTCERCLRKMPLEDILDVFSLDLKEAD